MPIALCRSELWRGINSRLLPPRKAFLDYSSRFDSGFAGKNNYFFKKKTFKNYRIIAKIRPQNYSNANYHPWVTWVAANFIIIINWVNSHKNGENMIYLVSRELNSCLRVKSPLDFEKSIFARISNSGMEPFQ